MTQLGCEGSSSKSAPAEPAPVATAVQPMTQAPPAEANAVVATIEIKNPTDAARRAETISIALPELSRLGIAPKQIVVVTAAGQPVLSQLVDDDGDEVFDSLIFQADLAAREAKQLEVRFGKRTLPAKEAYKVYARFVRERHDDFAWENDRIARRMYGADLETWKLDPLVSSGIDSWNKRTSRLVLNDWYLTDDYHHDNGEGADMYSVGKSRGCGGLGIWTDDNLHVSRNFVKSRVLANGPLRLIFELDYPEWPAGSLRVSETKRITLDAGKQFERHDSTFHVSQGRAAWQVGLGIAKHKGSELKADAGGHWLRTWEPLEDGSHLGCGLALPPSAAGSLQQTASDYLLVSPVEATGHITYHAGFAWDRGGHVADAAAWDNEVQGLALALEQPVALRLAAGSGGMPWSIRACNSVLRSDAGSSWDPGVSFLAASCLRAAAQHHQAELLARAKQVGDRLVAADPRSLDPSAGNLLFELYSVTESPSERERYERALRALQAHVAASPEGTAWVDDASKVAPWLARFAHVSGQPALYDEAVRQLETVATHARDPRTGLLFHGWDATKQAPWADKQTGASPVLWARGSGWYALALVDVLAQLPAAHPKRAALLGQLQQLGAALVSVQDPMTGTFWQVIDAAKRDKNYREASASALIAYALTKASEQGLLQDATLASAGATAYRGVLDQFVDVDAAGHLSLEQTTKEPGAGDHSYEQYASAGTVKNDPTGAFAFVMASLARE